MPKLETLDESSEEVREVKKARKGMCAVLREALGNVHASELSRDLEECLNQLESIEDGGEKSFNN